jgi:hypothetical protein
VGRGAGAGQGCAPPPPRPRAPFIGTQGGPLPAGSAGGPHAGRLRRLPRASKSEIQPRHNLHSRQPLEGKQRRMMVLPHPSGSQRRRDNRVSVPRRQSQTTGLGEKNPVMCTRCFDVCIAVLGACCALRSCCPIFRECYACYVTPHAFSRACRKSLERGKKCRVCGR